jgi:hypothetical protein
MKGGEDTDDEIRTEHFCIRPLWALIALAFISLIKSNE